jgi:small conductance mechanosensitive channel
MTLPADFQDRFLDLVRDPILPIAFILVAAFLLIRFARAFVHTTVAAVFDREVADGTARELSAVEIHKRVGTLSTLGTNVIEAFILIIALVMILGELGLDIAPAIAGLGVVGIAVGFGSQSLVRDYFNGSLILIENQFSRGDVISIAGVTGTVEDFSLRRTTIRDLDGIVHTVPNGEIKVASNRTRVWARINLDVTVAYGTDIERATEVVNEVGAEMAADPAWRRIVLEAPRVERVEALGEYGITLKVLGQVRATEQPAASGELRRRLLLAFARHGIEIPKPQRVVLAPHPELDPFESGGTTLRGSTQEDLAAGGD